MGYILKAECRICNYETTAKFGGGRFDYQTNNPVPAYNKVTEEIESVTLDPDHVFPDYNESNNVWKAGNGKIEKDIIQNNFTCCLWF